MAIPRSALVADDEAHIRTYVRMILKQLGVGEVHEARTGEQALELFGEKKPEVVFLDINMPGLSGLEVLPKILEKDPDAAVIMLTGHASRRLIESSAQKGALHYIRKDTPKAEITKLLKDLFEDTFEDE
ncbi:MAG: response regulator [Oceanipulchritudo sp.]